MVIADTTAALCDDAAVRDAVVRREVLGAALEGAARVGVLRDGREEERRLRARAALRYGDAWTHANAVWPWMGESCGRLREKDELTYLVGLMAGVLGMLHDKASGSSVGVPLDTLARAGRAGRCVDDARWWHVPSTLEAASWTLVPGSAPDGVDPWEAMEEAARRGGQSGVRLGWALQAVLAGNAGRDDRVRTAVAEAGAADLPEVPEAYALLDAFARDLLQFEADRLSIRDEGHRAAGLVLPTPAVAPPLPAVDPFADDPFAQEP